jgi:hypothetical protein
VVEVGTCRILEVKAGQRAELLAQCENAVVACSEFRGGKKDDVPTAVKGEVSRWSYFWELQNREEAVE